MGNPKQHMSDADAIWLAETFRRNRARFAGWRMEADPPGDPAPADPPPADPPADPPKDADDGKGGKDAILGDLAKERDKRQALETTVTEMQAAHKQQMDALAVAFGLKVGDEPPDAAKLAEQITAEQGKATDAEARASSAERQLSIFRLSLAGKHEGNPLALLDSATFLNQIKDVDPTDEAAVLAAVTSALDANPSLKATAPTPPFPGGARKTSTQPDVGAGLPRLRDAYAQSSK